MMNRTTAGHGCVGKPLVRLNDEEFGGSAHSPRRKCADAGQVSWLESMMATTGDSENMCGCNIVEFISRLA
jgi:hypothetical protein